MPSSEQSVFGIEDMKNSQTAKERESEKNLVMHREPLFRKEKL
jgi:hypothetical protein